MDNPFEFAFDNSKYSDYTLVLKSNGQVHKTIYVNSIILALYSTYFVALFTNDMKETHQKVIEIELDHYESVLFCCIVRSLYTGKLVLPSLSELSFELEQPQSQLESQVSENETHNVEGEENSQKKKGKGKEKDEEDDKKGKKRKVDEKEEQSEGERIDINKDKEKEEEREIFLVNTEENKKFQVCVDVIKLLDRFSIQKRFSQCVDLFKEDKLSITSGCYRFSLLSESFEHITEIKEYTKTIVDFLANEYSKMWSENEFLQLPYLVIEKILQSDNLLVSCEETVLQALRKWINHCPDQRSQYLIKLLPLVRFFQIEFAYLTDYVWGYKKFFDCGDFEILQKYVFGAIRYHSFINVYYREKGCFSDNKFPEDWLKKRLGYKIDESSETVEWECDLDSTNQISKAFYFRGVFYCFNLKLQNGEHFFCIEPQRLLTSGEEDTRNTNVRIYYLVTAFNYQTNKQNTINDQFMDGVNIGNVIDKELKLSQEFSPYIKPNEGSKRLVRLFASLKKKAKRDERY